MSDLRLFWWSNSPTMKTGYGEKTTGKINVYLHKEGWDTIIMGQQTVGSAERYPCGGHCEKGVMVLPQVTHYGGQASLPLLARRFKRNVFVVHHDLWGFPIELFKQAAQVMDFVFYGPIDHTPLSPLMIPRLQKPLCRLAIPQSQFGKRVIEAVSPNQGLMPPCLVIPGSVDCQTYKPIPELRKKAQDSGLTRFVYVKANKGERANFPSLLKAFAWFLKEEAKEVPGVERPSPEKVELYLHTEPNSEHGYDLPQLCEMLNIGDYVTYPGDYCSDEKCLGRTEVRGEVAFCKTCKKPGQDLNAADSWINAMLQSCSAHFNPCHAEGFGLPIVESMAAGVPVFHTDFAAGAEHIPPEWRLAIINLFTTRLLADQAFVDEERVMEKMRFVYAHPEWFPKASEQARRLGLAYDDSVILPMWGNVMQELDAHQGQKRVAKWGSVEVPA